MHLGPSITQTAQSLCTLQVLLYSLNGWGLHFAERSMRRTPDGFSRELHAERAHELLLATFECWHLSAFLPDRAANDEAQHAPGAA